MEEAAAKSELRKFGAFLAQLSERVGGPERAEGGLGLVAVEPDPGPLAVAVATRSGNVLIDKLSERVGGAERGGLGLVAVEPDPGPLAVAVATRSGNVLIDKVVLALSGVIEEARELSQSIWWKHLPPLVVYGEEGEDTNSLLQLARFLPFLQELSRVGERARKVMGNTLLQLGALRVDRKEAVVGLDKRASLLPVWEGLGELAANLILLDHLIASHPLIRDHWASYLKTVQVVQMNPGKFGLNAADLKPLERQVLARLQTTVIDANIYANCVGQPIGGLSKTGIAEDLAACLLKLVNEWNQKLDTGRRTGLESVSLCALSGLYTRLCQTPEKKSLKLLWETEKSVDALSLLGIGERALAGPLSLHRLRLAQLCLNLAALPRHLRSEDVDAISLLLRRMIIVREAVSGPRLFDTSCLIFHSALLPTLLDSCLNESGWAQRLPGIAEAISGGGWLLDSARHCDPAQIRKKSHHFSDIFQEELVAKVCSAAEVELRLSTHTHLQLDDRNPYSTGEARPGLDVLLRLPPLRLLTATLHLRSALTAYLTRTFYNLSAVALTDWPRYAEMGGVAEARWGLDLKPPALPAHAVSEAGLDLLQITRHLPVFLAKYHYHINSQTFIEKSSKSRHLNTLGLEQVSKSLRAHGTGIMNTTVNFTYQFLRKKFYVFSQFLYDDQIKSRLQKDARFFKEHKDELNGKYPMERAKKMNSGIRRLGLTADGRSYLDQFRGLVTEIGNALGYVRLLRSAGLVVGAEAVEFLPDLDDVVSVRPLIDAAACFGTTAKDAAHHLDGLVQDILTSTSTNYFKCIELLVDVFSEQFRDPKHVHLRNFYAMVPPLVVNFVEEAVGRRERMGKRAVDGDAGSFTDDGFVMGLAYILRLLDQYDAFDSLQWFKSVKATFKAEKADYTAQKSSVGGDAKLGATLELSLRRLCEYEREYDLVRFGLRSARIFFRTDLAEGLTGPVDDKSDTRSLASQGSRHTES